MHHSYKTWPACGRLLCKQIRFLPAGAWYFPPSTRCYGVSVPKIFDGEVKRLQKNRAASSNHFSDFQYIHDEVAGRLVERTRDINAREFPKVLDYGATLRGAAYENLIEYASVQEIVQASTSDQILKVCEASNCGGNVKPELVQLPVSEKVPFPQQTFDMVISSLELHWINDLPGVLLQLNKVLKPDGVFLGCLFGESTLEELRTAFLIAEQEREGGISPHVSPFTRVSDVGDLLSRAEFSLPTIDTEKLKISYDNAFVLMEHLNRMGESNCIITRRRFVSRETFLATSAIYQSLYSEDDGIPATFQVIYVIGWSPHESQSKPLERGSAEFSLSDLGDVKKL